MRNFSCTATLAGLALLVTALACPSRALAGYPCYPDGCRVDYLISQLQFARDEDDREDAAKELGKIGDPRALPALRRAAACDCDKHVRKKACKAIERIREDFWDGDYACYYDDDYAYYRPYPSPPVINRVVPPRVFYPHHPWRGRPYWRP